jgi:predicted lactoylglutathione lyase
MFHEKHGNVSVTFPVQEFRFKKQNYTALGFHADDNPEPSITCGMNEFFLIEYL